MRLRLQLAIAVAIGLLVTFTLHAMVSEWEIGWKSAEFQHTASVNGQAVHRAIRYAIEVLHSVRTVATDDKGKYLFQGNFAAEALKRHATIRAIEFSHIADPDTLSPFPLVRIAPRQGTVSRELLDDPIRLRAMERARDLDTPVATAPMALPDDAGETGWVLVLPVFLPHHDARDSLERRASLVGFVHEVIVAAELLQAALRNYDLDSMVVILERSDSSTPFVEVARLAGAGSGAPTTDNRFRWEGQFRAAETSWRIVVQARESYRESRERPLSGIILAVGLLLTGVAGFRFARLLEADRRMREENERYVRELAVRDARLREELALARVIQKALLPSTIPSIPGLDIGLSFVPSGEIGGDYFDFIPDEKGRRLDVVFADLCGHGIPAALLFAVFRTLARNAFRSPHSPVENFLALNRQLTKIFPRGRFASTFFARFDVSGGRISYVKASQEPGIVLRSDGSVEMLEEGDRLLGALNPEFFGDPEYVERSVRLNEGDLVLLFTDGLVEVEDAAGKQLGVEGLLVWLREDNRLGAQVLVDGLYRRALAYAGRGDLRDDFTVVAIRVTGE